MNSKEIICLNSFVLVRFFRVSVHHAENYKPYCYEYFVVDARLFRLFLRLLLFFAISMSVCAICHSIFSKIAPTQNYFIVTDYLFDRETLIFMLHTQIRYYRSFSFYIFRVTCKSDLFGGTVFHRYRYTHAF